MPPNRKRVFFLTYYFPPLGGVIALRNAKTARYLADFGWDAVVFSAGAGTIAVTDPSLLQELPSDMRRIPVRTYEAASLHKALHAVGLRYFSYRIPRLYPIDPQIGWLPSLLKKVDEEIALHGKPDAIFTSAAPFSVNIAGLRMRAKHGIPWIADFQDEWSLNPGIQWLTPLHRKLAVTYEEKTMREADGIVTVTPQLVQRFQSARPAGKLPVGLLRDGYDEADFQAPPPPKIADKWTLAHIGTVYFNTDPRPILDLLIELINAGRIDPDKVRVVQVGRGNMDWPVHPPFEKMETGFLAHGEAVAWMRKCHALLILRKEISASSGKIYEYMRSGTPVIAVADVHGEVANLLDETKTGHVYDIADKQGLTEALLASYAAWVRGAAAETQPTPALHDYSRRAQTQTLAKMLDAVTKTRTA